ncbi:SH3 domain-containing protein [Paraburkholderia humisilvae]|uniref:SH3 domain-containing protein n=1 Tax=Paraburkholderia humisilvae TaxID=627669 RepID=UPI0015840DEC|nr:SH3 domain-containing protein [Paraburkholderia humisilvae]
MRRPTVQHAFLAVVSLFAFPAVGLGQSQAFTNRPANVRAGPGRDYPIVTQLAYGAPVTVAGCLSDYSWCDVALPRSRGWVYARSLNYPYQGSYVPVISYGPAIGLPVVPFSIGPYWSSHYRGKPWYRDQSRWAHRPPPRPGPGHRPGHVQPRPPGGRPPSHTGHPPGGSRPPHGGSGGRPPRHPS